MLVRCVQFVLIVLFASPKSIAQPAPKWDPKQLVFRNTFDCDSYSKIDDIERFDIKRLAYSYKLDMIFMFLDYDKVVYFKAPKLSGKGSSDGQYSLTVGTPFITQNAGFRGPFNINNLLGHVYLINEKTNKRDNFTDYRAIEIYTGPWEENGRPYNEEANEIDLDINPGRIKDENIHSHLKITDPIEMKSMYLNCILVGIIVGRRNAGIPQITLDHTYCNQTSYPSIKAFTMWLRTFDAKKPLKLTGMFITADNKVLISEKTFDYSEYLERADKEVFHEINSFEVGPIPVIEFLSCQTTFSDPREVKGFLFTEKGGPLAIFARYYVQLPTDDVDVDYLPVSMKAYNLRYEREEVEDVRFEIYRSVWVKTIGEEVYFVPHEASGKAYELHVNDATGLIEKLEEISDPPKINCSFSTLLIKRKLFCFEGKHSIID